MRQQAGCMSRVRGFKERFRLVVKHGESRGSTGSWEVLEAVTLPGQGRFPIPWELLSPLVTPALASQQANLNFCQSLHCSWLLNGFINYLQSVKADNSDHIMHHLC